MKKHPSPPSPALAACAVLLAMCLTGCETPPPDRRETSTEYLDPAVPAATPRHRATVDAETDAVPRAREHASRVSATPRPRATTASATPPPGRPPRKTEAEVRDASDLQIDNATRQKMGMSGEKTADPEKKAKAEKVEAEVRDASDLQIDDQTKKQMDKPN